MPLDQWKRREFITLLGGAATSWPMAARAQQRRIRVVGFLYPGAPEAVTRRMAAFRSGLAAAGLVEGRDVAIEYRFAYNDSARLPELAADLVRRQVELIVVAGGTAAALAAKAATTTIPIVFRTGGDPVDFGLVASLNRPGGNITGFADMAMELAPKRLGLLHDLLPGAERFAVLFDPRVVGDNSVANLQAAASRIGRQIEVLFARNNGDIDTAFADLARVQADALLVSPHVLFANRIVQIVTLAAHLRVPTIYSISDYVEIGGLMSCGPNGADQWRQLALYTSRILNGEKPADLPIMRAVKFEFVINLLTAKVLGLTVPATLLAQADETIE